MGVLGSIGHFVGNLFGQDDRDRARKLETQALQGKQQSYDERVGLRNQGLQTLGQIEAPIDMGMHSYNPTNPFAAARGPSASVATLGNWGDHTFKAPLEVPLSQQSPEQQQQADQRVVWQQMADNPHAPAHMRQQAQAALRRLPPATQATTYGGQ